jgi:GNAT superfamily N-acetyltransferase
MAVIKPLVEEHCAGCTRLARELHIESTRYGETTDFCQDRALEYAREHLSWPLTGWVALVDREVVGMFLAYATRVPYGNQTFCGEHVFFVTKAHRGSRLGSQLIDAYVTWARELGANYAMIGTTTGLAEGRTVDLLKHKGFDDFGKVMRVVF